MENKQIFKVILRPMNSYFFGNERNFLFEGSNYFARSSFWPQQTSVLGAIRYVLLKQNGFIPLSDGNRENAGLLIGPQSFNISDEKLQVFGVIKSISPIFLENKSGCLRAVEKDYGFAMETVLPGKVDFAGGKPKSYIPELKGYDAKDGLPSGFANSDGLLVDDDQVYNKESIIGIQKKKKDKNTPEEGFYKQEFIRLKNDFEFFFYLTLKDNAKYTVTGEQNKVQIRIEDDVFPVGAEKHCFQIRVEKTENDDYQRFFEVKPSNKLRIILVSDALVKEDLFDCCFWSVAETTDFRNLMASVSGTKYYNRMIKGVEDSKRENLNRSQKFNLLKKGSVLHFENSIARDIAIKKLNIESLRQIGMNHYILK